MLAPDNRDLEMADDVPKTEFESFQQKPKLPPRKPKNQKKLHSRKRTELWLQARQASRRTGQDESQLNLFDLETSRLKKRLQKLIELHACSSNYSQNFIRQKEREIGQWEADESSNSCRICNRAFIPQLNPSNAESSFAQQRPSSSSSYQEPLMIMQTGKQLANSFLAMIGAASASASEPPSTRHHCRICGTLICSGSTCRLIMNGLEGMPEKAALQVCSRCNKRVFLTSDSFAVDSANLFISNYEKLSRLQFNIKHRDLPMFLQLKQELKNANMQDQRQLYQSAHLLRKRLLDGFREIDELSAIMCSSSSSTSTDQKTVCRNIRLAMQAFIGENSEKCRMDVAAPSALTQAAQDLKAIAKKHQDSAIQNTDSTDKNSITINQNSDESSTTALNNNEDNDYDENFQKPPPVFQQRALLYEQQNQLFKFISEARRQARLDELEPLSESLRQVQQAIAAIEVDNE